MPHEPPGAEWNWYIVTRSLGFVNARRIVPGEFGRAETEHVARHRALAAEFARDAVFTQNIVEPDHGFGRIKIGAARKAFEPLAGDGPDVFPFRLNAPEIGDAPGINNRELGCGCGLDLAGGLNFGEHGVEKRIQAPMRHGRDLKHRADTGLV